MKQLKLFKSLVDLAQIPPELIEALRLFEQANEMQIVELNDPALTVADCLAMKRAGERAAATARGYALKAERELGFCLLAMGAGGKSR